MGRAEYETSGESEMGECVRWGLKGRSLRCGRGLRGAKSELAEPSLKNKRRCLRRGEI